MAIDVSLPADLSGYSLPLPAAERPAAGGGVSGNLPESMLFRNVGWFCQLRWVAVGMLVAVGLIGAFGCGLEDIGLRARASWPLIIAAVLAVSNGGYMIHARLMTRSELQSHARFNLWSQIVVDLLLLTMVVHFAGSLKTYVAFLYLIHITLACIFFSRGQSLAVTTLAAVLYLSCVGLEVAGVIQPMSIYTGESQESRAGLSRVAVVIDVASALAIWLMMWYLVAHLSARVRERDLELAENNRRLLQAQEDRAQHMLRTTHELKAPFAAIHANVQLLLKGYCGLLSAEVIGVLDKIGVRCARLAKEIQEMVQLANVSSAEGKPLCWSDIDLAEELKWCVDQAHPLAEERGVTVEMQLQPARAVAVHEQLRMMFANLLANAIIYSHRGGCVRVGCSPGPEGSAQVSFEDQGIGIPAEKLPRIFEEYYRTEEAASHNQASTGLGLAIVRQIAQVNRIDIRVESRVAVGTRFILRLPGRA